MLEMFGDALGNKLGLSLADCSGSSGTFIYLDDGIYTGNRILGDLRSWIESDAPEEASVHIIVIALHRGGQYYARTKLNEASKAAGKTIKTSWWRCVELEDRKAYTYSADVLRPTEIPDDQDVQEYVEGLSYPPTRRTPGNPGENKFFSSEVGRHTLEQEFLKAGVRIRSMCPYLNDYQRPLGNSVLEPWDSVHCSLPSGIARTTPHCSLGWRTLVSVVPTKDQLMFEASQTRTYNRDNSVSFRQTKERYGGLSNMAPGFPIVVNGIRIPTSEALYQACRFPNRPDVQRQIVRQRSPMTAKMKAKRFINDTRHDWDSVRVNVMRWCLRVKLAQNWTTFGRLLLSTGDAPIVEDSRKDAFWGAKRTDDGELVGTNALGRLLMELREELKSQVTINLGL